MVTEQNWVERLCARCGIRMRVNHARVTPGMLCRDCRTVERVPCEVCGTVVTVHGMAKHRKRSASCRPPAEQAATEAPPPPVVLEPCDGFDAALYVAGLMLTRGLPAARIIEVTGLTATELGMLRWDMHARPGQVARHKATVDMYTRTGVDGA